MSRVRSILLSLVAVFAMSAVTASGASAFKLVWEVKKGGVFRELKAGEREKVTTKATTDQILTDLGLEIACSNLTGKGELIGGKPGTETVTELLYTGCIVTPACKVESPNRSVGEIQVTAIASTLVSKETGATLGNLFKPKTGTTFFELELGKKAKGGKLEEKCSGFPLKTKVTGEVVAKTSGHLLQFKSPPVEGSNFKMFGVGGELVGEAEQQGELAEDIRAA